MNGNTKDKPATTTTLSGLIDGIEFNYHNFAKKNLPKNKGVKKRRTVVRSPTYLYRNETLGWGKCDDLSASSGVSSDAIRKLGKLERKGWKRKKYVREIFDRERQDTGKRYCFGEFSGSSKFMAEMTGVAESTVIKRCKGYTSRGKTYPPKKGWYVE